jgi:hypothetical protein
MRNLLALLAAVLLAFASAGFWRGWYRVEGLPSEPGRSAFRVEIDRAKVAGDVGDAARRVIRVLTREQEKPASEPAANP